MRCLSDECKVIKDVIHSYSNTQPLVSCNYDLSKDTILVTQSISRHTVVYQRPRKMDGYTSVFTAPVE